MGGQEFRNEVMKTERGRQLNSGEVPEFYVPVCWTCYYGPLTKGGEHGQARASAAAVAAEEHGQAHASAAAVAAEDGGDEALDEDEATAQAIAESRAMAESLADQEDDDLQMAIFLSTEENSWNKEESCVRGGAAADPPNTGSLECAGIENSEPPSPNARCHTARPGTSPPS